MQKEKNIIAFANLANCIFKDCGKKTYLCIIKSQTQMLSDSFKQDFNQFLNSKHTAVDFMIFLKYHPEARNIIQNYDKDYHYLEFMSEEEIHRIYDPLSHNLNPTDNFNYEFPLSCLMHAMEEDKDILDEAEKKARGFSVLLNFKAGIPNVCNIRIGDEFQESWTNAVEEGNTGDYDIDKAIDDYGALIECNLDYCETIHDITITLPFEEWSYEDVKALYAYISKEFYYDDRKASYSFDNDNGLSDTDIQLSNSLYGISIYKKTHYGRENLIIEVVQKREEATIYQALNTLAFNDAKEIDHLVYSTLKEILFNIKLKK